MKVNPNDLYKLFKYFIKMPEYLKQKLKGIPIFMAFKIDFIKSIEVHASLTIHGLNIIYPDTNNLILFKNEIKNQFHSSSMLYMS